MDELVKSIDALSREQLALLVASLGLSRARLPVLLPGAAVASLPLAPKVSEEDRRVRFLWIWARSLRVCARPCVFVCGVVCLHDVGGKGGVISSLPLAPKVAEDDRRVSVCCVPSCVCLCHVSVQCGRCKAPWPACFPA